MSSENDDTTKFEKVKRHVKENKKVYAAAIGGVVVGGSVVGGIVMIKFGQPDIIQTFANSSDNVAPIVSRSKNVKIVIDYINERNYVANPTRCVETNEEWPSQVEAAIAKNIAPWLMSKHLNGKLPHAAGLHFERVSS